MTALRDGPLENLWGAGEVQKNILAHQLALKNIHAKA